ncbi:hypothetical protein, variant [Verruconis gallopava]|uniref:Zn(2)-C6 fungal-type domain-containing protein n=1 Tax=Verruconis gallopava TaxID=253628 RepID=A0A0D2AL10_9PEZI|nr:hypothetical protein, variant [Verruconis gallopava]KIV99743.1 hypothetical protein, variant [Verruconis gallopava]
MAGPGGGPSRRSHTKSRKGCKTCKRRHIRCDETFPQCRNCTKHQVRCDYMDSPAPGDAGMSLSGQANVLWTPDVSRAVDQWQSTGQFPFPDLQIYPQPQWQSLARDDLRLIYHLLSVCSEMVQSRTSKLTIWTELLPRFMGVAASYPFVMHAILAFSANHLAWISQSAETRTIASAHGATAMKGLHEATLSFSKSNADAVLASSLLLSWQSTDWRGWASLMLNIRNLLNETQSWPEQSSIAELIEQQGLAGPSTFANEATIFSPEGRQEHLNTLHKITAALVKLQPYLATCEQESRWIDQLAGYIERLRTSNPPVNSEEQFAQLYALRKWLFWMPVTLLSSKKGDIFTLLVLSHFYATALAIEPMFPNIGGPFLANLALPSLEELIRIMNTVQTSNNFTSMTQAAAMMMEFPRDVLSNYRAHRDWSHAQSPGSMQPHPYTIDALNLDLGQHLAEFGYNQSLSPAFAPSPLHMSPPNVLPGQGSRSPYLEVPRTGSVDMLYSGTGSNYSSPMTSPAIFKQEEENVFNFGMPFGGYSNGGFVLAPTATIF